MITFYYLLARLSSINSSVNFIDMRTDFIGGKCHYNISLHMKEKIPSIICYIPAIHFLQWIGIFCKVMRKYKVYHRLFLMPKHIKLYIWWFLEFVKRLYVKRVFEFLFSS